MTTDRSNVFMRWRWDGMRRDSKDAMGKETAVSENKDPALGAARWPQWTSREETRDQFPWQCKYQRIPIASLDKFCWESITIKTKSGRTMKERFFDNPVELVGFLSESTDDSAEGRRDHPWHSKSRNDECPVPLVRNFCAKRPFSVHLRFRHSRGWELKFPRLPFSILDCDCLNFETSMKRRGSQDWETARACPSSGWGCQKEKNLGLLGEPSPQTWDCSLAFRQLIMVPKRISTQNWEFILYSVFPQQIFEKRKGKVVRTMNDGEIRIGSDGTSCTWQGKWLRRSNRQWQVLLRQWQHPSLLNQRAKDRKNGNNNKKKNVHHSNTNSLFPELGAIDPPGPWCNYDEAEEEREAKEELVKNKKAWVRRRDCLSNSRG